jgi:hypothetical protein
MQGNNIKPIYVSDIMPSKHNSLPSIIYLVIRLQCFDLLSYYIQLSIFSSLPVQTVYYPVKHTGSRLARKIWNVIHFLFLYRPDDDPVKGRNIVA